jgi:steroid 5-alpha reductase family enzyme
VRRQRLAGSGFALLAAGTLAGRLAGRDRAGGGAGGAPRSPAARAADVRACVATALALAWAVRLGVFLVRRIARHGGRDPRFDRLRASFPAFLAAWTLQGVWTFVASLPVLVLNSAAAEGPALGAAEGVGWALWALGFAIEVLADAQKSRHLARADGTWVSTGLWALCRHPNYLGEILLWAGLCVSGCSAYRGGQWLALLSPLFVAALLLRVTGVPLLEARADARWGHEPEYARYRAETPVLLPRWPQRRGGA